MGTQSRFDHIQISTKVTTEKRTLATKMGVMKIKQTALIGLCLVTLMGAFPKSYESTTLGPREEGCEYEDKEITETVKEEDYVTKCETDMQCVCENKSVSHCLNYTTVESLCEDYKEEVCEMIPQGACSPITKTINETYLTPQCYKKEEEHCKYHWETRTKGHGIVEKIWAKIPSSCEKTLVDMCEDVQLWRLREVTVEEYVDQKFKICADVLKTRCTQRDVVKKHCTTENIQVCKNEEKEVCKKWHILKDVPKIRTIHIKKCKDITQEDNSVESETEVLEIQ